MGDLGMRLQAQVLEGVSMAKMYRNLIVVRFAAVGM